jgi:hypothetical protein
MGIRSGKSWRWVYSLFFIPPLPLVKKKKKKEKKILLQRISFDFNTSKKVCILYYSFFIPITCADSWGTFSRNRANLLSGNWIQTSTVMLGGMGMQMWMKMEGK